MSNNSSSVDGFFIPRRERREITASKPQARPKPSAAPAPRPTMNQTAKAEGESIQNFFGGSADHALPSPDLPDIKPRRRGSAKNGAGGNSGKNSSEGKGRFHFGKPSRKAVKRGIIILVILLLLVGGYFVYRFFMTTGKVFQGNVLSAILSQGKPLKTDTMGRSNILLFGTSEDDPEHEGAELSDSIMVASIDQKKNNVFLISIPRDLYVKYGKACISGYEGRINEVYMCGKGDRQDGDEQAGQSAFRKTVSEVTGLDVQYSAHVNYTALRQAVDAVGGITVTIESDDPRGILDRNFDWRCNYTCYFVKYENGPVNLDGEHALALARARGAAGGYGLPNANFDREKNQRKIIVALKDKATSAGTLANPVAVDKLLSALGDNVRTNIDAEEIKTVLRVAKDTKTKDIVSIPLNDPEEPLVTTGDVGGQSIVRPMAGLYDYDQIAAHVKAVVSGDAAMLEKAKVDVLNASGEAGAAGKQAEKVTDAGIVVEVVGNAPSELNTAPLRIYDLSEGQKPATLKKLEMLFGSKAVQTAPAGVTSNSDFVIIVGSNGTPQDQ
ncbi:LCP family protein [Candidatus Saccharibacteria bacterium]|nr:LCP family protein [Candidatus Saccharibacteria bacterium]